ncbi:deoxyribodipyrimidine photo-lyase [Vibrio sp.]|uniref:deoxyribodipyrimidine photo-lyase n=1 Tax=Vibrio sp. TaxID=678 RepID=UPI003D106443
MKLVWLRRDLRAVDNTALRYAITSTQPVYALYIATPQQWQQHGMAAIQADLIYRRLFELQQELAALNVPLLYIECDDFSQAAQAVAEMSAALGVDQVLVNREYEYNEQQRDALAQRLLAEQAIEWCDFDDKCVIPPGQVLTKQGDYFKVFTPFKRAWLTQFVPPTILTTPVAQKVQVPEAYRAYVWSEAQPFTYPRYTSEQWPVDFDAIRQQLRQFCQHKVDEYHQQRDYPAQEYTSRLSAYLAIGAISARQCLARLYTQSTGGVLSAGADMWMSELVWREFYQHLMAFEAKLSQGKDFHSWAAQLVWYNDTAAFERWCEGQTGFPIVDAAMRQLKQTGWMHNRLRMIVASFLTKDLHIDWRWGEDYFMRHLIDGDYASNNGGWQWCASTGCDGQPYFRIFNPITQGEKFDPNGQFIRQWVPELAHVPLTYLHSPWTWSEFNLVSYPSPMVDHKVQREVTLRLYKEAKEMENGIA